MKEISKPYKGKETLRKDLPKKEIDRCKKIVEQWKYCDSEN